MQIENVISSKIRERFGIDVSTQIKRRQNNRSINIRPSGFERTIGFDVIADIKWRSIEIKFVPGSFAIDLIRLMENSDDDQRSAFKLFANSLLNKGAELNLLINHSLYKLKEIEEWPSNWKSLEISMRKGNIVFENELKKDLEKVNPWIISFFGLCISLIPFEPLTEVDEENSNVVEEEGLPYTVNVTRYERSSLNRAACLEIYGTICKVCSIDFGDVYGEIGEGYIHVHHKIPLSEIKESYIVDPEKDLVPVCPNCHAMLHKKSPPFTIEELKQKLKK